MSKKSKLSKAELSEIKRKAANARWNYVRQEVGLAPVPLTHKSETTKKTKKVTIQLSPEAKLKRSEAAKRGWEKRRAAKAQPIVQEVVQPIVQPIVQEVVQYDDNVAVITTPPTVIPKLPKKRAQPIQKVKKEIKPKEVKPKQPKERKPRQPREVKPRQPRQPRKKILEIVKPNLPEVEEHPKVKRNELLESKRYWRILTQNKLKKSEDFEQYAYSLPTMYTISRDIDPDGKSTDNQLKEKPSDINDASIHVKYDGKCIYLVAGTEPSEWGLRSLVANTDNTVFSLLVWAYRLMDKIIPNHEGGTLAFQYVNKETSIDYNYYKNEEGIVDMTQLNQIMNPKRKTTYSLRSAPVGGIYRTDYYKYPVLDALYALYNWAYHEDSDSVGAESANVIRIIPFFRKRTENVRVAKYQLGNCFMKLIENELESRRDSKRTFNGIVDKNFDKLCKMGVVKAHPMTNTVGISKDFTYVNFKQMFELAKIFELNLTIYSQFGRIVDLPWIEERNNEHLKSIKVCVSNNHCNIIKTAYEINDIQYVDNNFEGMTNILGGQFVDVVETRENEFGKYYIRYDSKNKKSTMYKTWKPSDNGLKSNVVDEFQDIDQMPKYFRCLGAPEILFKLFTKTYFIKQTPIDMFPIIRSGCLFFGKRIISELSESVVKIDHNKSYSSYKNCKYYKGFPDQKLRLAHRDIIDGDYVAFVIGSPSYIPDKYKRMYNILYGDMTVFTSPMYRFLIDIGFVFDIKYKVVTGTYHDVDIWRFLEDYDDIIDPKEKKLCLNSFLGKTVMGGIKPTRNYCFKSEDQEELEHINEEIYKTFKGRIPTVPKYDIDSDRIVELRADIPQVPKGSYHFYSYILQYSHIQVMSKWIELEDKGAKICGYHVDSLILEPNNADLNLNTEKIGEWKLEMQSPETFNKYKSYQILNNNFEQHQPICHTDIDNLPKKIHLPYKRYLINGSAGIGKSFPFISDPYDDSIILTPTLALKESHLETVNKLLDSDDYDNEQKSKIFFMKDKIHTAAKYFQFNLQQERIDMLRAKGSIPEIAANVILDEGCMFDRTEFNLILLRTENLSNLCVLLDFEQIHKELSGDKNNAVDIDYFKQNGFVITEIERGEDDSHTRHKLEYGQFLDSLRGCNYNTQKDLIYRSQLFDKIVVDDYNDPILLNFNHVIVGTHMAGRTLNINYANKHNTIKCRVKKRSITFRDLNNNKVKKVSGQLCELSSNDESIWWDRTKFDDKTPPNKAFEPAYACTVDSFQGTTLHNERVGICINELKKHGALYSALTRTKTPEQVVLIVVRNVEINDTDKVHIKNNIIQTINSKDGKFEDVDLADISLKILVEMQRFMPKFIKINPTATLQLQNHHKDLLNKKKQRAEDAKNVILKFKPAETIIMDVDNTDPDLPDIEDIGDLQPEDLIIEEFDYPEDGDIDYDGYDEEEYFDEPEDDCNDSYDYAGNKNENDFDDFDNDLLPINDIDRGFRSILLENIIVKRLIIEAL